MSIRIKRVYDPPSQQDDLRVLVDRLWPRGLKKQDAAIDLWAKEVAPSTELRHWFGHNEERFEEFTCRYRRELEQAGDQIGELVEAMGSQTVTLVYAARNISNNNAVVLRQWLEGES